MHAASGRTARFTPGGKTAVAITQSYRPFAIKVQGLGDDDLLLDTFTGHECVSTPFRYVVKLAAAKTFDLKGLLAKSAVLSIGLEGSAERYIHGHISRIKLLEQGEDGLFAYEAELVPWLWFLTRYSDCRIFQNQSVQDIVEKVFRDRGFSDFEWKLTGSYTPREYCVQYRETDFNFVSRLLEDEGIFYFFKQAKDKHTLVLGDGKSAFVACPNKAQARFLASTGSAQPAETVISLENELRVHTGAAALTDYDFEKPTTSLMATLSGDMRGEDYDYPGKYKTKSEGDRYARIRLEEREVDLTTAAGTSNCMGFECGYTFKLVQHPMRALNLEYAIVGLEQHGVNTSFQAGKPQPFEYHNRFTAIPGTVPFRPPRRARKPAISGTQTAVVVGRSGEEIFVDKYGRIKVQFFWDRVGQADENSSCWIRVATPWAGNNWGSIHTPRIGQEVVVSFLEGDPDRPLVTGSVYNAQQMPPYALPAEMTKSTLKSNSSKGSGGCNEFRLEDKKGSEEVFLQAEKNLEIRVKNDRKEWIGEDRHLQVTRDKLEKVGRDTHVEVTRDSITKAGRDYHLTIAGKSATKITGSHSLNVQGDVIEEFKANHSSQVMQNLYLKALQVVIEATTGITLKVGANFITIDLSGIAIKGMPMVQINSAGSALSGSPGSLVAPLAPTAALEAVTANPGSMQTPAGRSNTTAAMSLSDVSAGARATPPAGSGGGQPQPAASDAPSAAGGGQSQPAASDAPSPSAASGGQLQSAASDAPSHDPNSEENKTKTQWIEIKLVDQQGKPVAGEPYRVTLPDGTTVADGTTDAQGMARVENLDPGNCKVTFPNIDKDAWRPQ